jgi:dienelactone hydrolase
LCLGNGNVFHMRRLISPLLIALVATLGLAAEPAAPSALTKARAGHVTKLIKQESENEPAPAPPKDLFEKITYTSPAGKLAAYLSPAPKDDKKHPLVIWLVGGFSNSISEVAWEDSPIDNDQSAAAYRNAGLAMMYPSLRGGNDNPGHKEGFYGEVDDVLAAVEHAAKLPWVDPQRIYLGGHSTGGTLALLAAEAAPKGRLRAVFAFGPAEDPADYGRKVLPYDPKDVKERRLRAPIHFLDDISCTTLVIEGENGNAESLEALKQENANRNRTLNFTVAKGADHFTILSPANALLAAKILEDKGEECAIKISGEEIVTAIAKAKTNNFQPKGDLRGKGAAIGVVFYYTPDPAVPPMEALRKAVEKEMKGTPVFESFDDATEPPFIVLMEEKAPLKDYPVPEADYFKHVGRGLKDEDIKAIQKTSRASIAVLVTPTDGLWKRAKVFNKVAHEFAVAAGAHIWDSATRECFHRDAWKKRRIDSWGNGEIPDIRSQITIHNYQRDESGHIRSVTLGMEKFALPDVAVERSVKSDAKSVGSLINVFCQTIAANSVLKDPSRFPITLDALPVSLAKEYREDLIDKGTGKAELAIMRGTPDDGDPDNQQVALDFRHGKGADDDERRAELLESFWGAKDELIHVEHDEEIKKASEGARRKLTAMKEKFRKGLPAGSNLMVKGPFARDDQGSEWMWVEVLKWSDDDVLSGSLQNSPFHIKALKAGANVSLKLSEAFDYILRNPDGSMEGNETGELMQKKLKERDNE